MSGNIYENDIIILACFVYHARIRKEKEIMRLYIIRHAEPDYENDTITAEGHKQAEALAKKNLRKKGLLRYIVPH